MEIHLSCRWVYNLSLSPMASTALGFCRHRISTLLFISSFLVEMCLRSFLLCPALSWAAVRPQIWVFQGVAQAIHGQHWLRRECIQWALQYVWVWVMCVCVCVCVCVSFTSAVSLVLSQWNFLHERPCFASTVVGFNNRKHTVEPLITYTQLHDPALWLLYHCATAFRQSTSFKKKNNNNSPHSPLDSSITSTTLKLFVYALVGGKLRDSLWMSC